jgi:hypothetical protein
VADGPIFLAGLDRSGIGLLGEILEAHPDVAITRRTNFWEFYADRYGELSSPANLDRCLADMMRYTRISRLQPDVDRLRSDFLAGESSYPRLFRLLQEQNMERLGKKRWGDKSLGSEAQADAILSAFPAASMIYVLRDPRDRYASQAGHRSAGRGGVGSGVAMWKSSEKRAGDLFRRHPDRFRIVRYEDLVAEPQETVRSLCDLVAIDFVPEMLTTESDSPRPLHTGSIGRFRRDLTVGEIRFIEQMAGERMKARGYPPAHPPWSNAQRLRFAVTGFPAAAAGLVLWRPRAILRSKLGPGPSARRLGGR